MDKIQALLVIEILGRPPEHIKEALNTLVVKLGSEKGVRITNKNYYDPVPAKDSDSLFTTFAEIEVEFDSIENYFGILFAYMPSHVEVIYPEKITLTNSHLNEFANILVRRLHDYDAIAKKLVFERDVMMEKLKEVAPNLFKEQNAEAKINSKNSKVQSKAKKTKKKSNKKS